MSIRRVEGCEITETAEDEGKKNKCGWRQKDKKNWRKTKKKCPRLLSVRRSRNIFVACCALPLRRTRRHLYALHIFSPRALGLVNPFNVGARRKARRYKESAPLSLTRLRGCAGENLCNEFRLSHPAAVTMHRLLPAVLYGIELFRGFSHLHTQPRRKY